MSESDTLLSAPLNVTIREIEVNSAVVTWETLEGDPVIGFAITQQVPLCVQPESDNFGQFRLGAFKLWVASERNMKPTDRRRWKAQGDSKNNGKLFSFVDICCNAVSLFFFKWNGMLLHLCCGAPSANETLVTKSTAMSLSGNRDPVTDDNPQTLLWAESCRSYFLSITSHCISTQRQKDINRSLMLVTELDVNINGFLLDRAVELADGKTIVPTWITQRDLQ